MRTVAGEGGHGHGRGSTFESSGPEGKIRGTAQQVIERYQALGRDAMTAGDRIGAENFFQHAEHYFRVSSANGAGHRGGRERPPDPVVADSSADAATKSNGAGAATDSILLKQGETVRGHLFHWSDVDLPPAHTAYQLTDPADGPEGFIGGPAANILASYLHLHFGTRPQAAENFVKNCAAWAQKGRLKPGSHTR